MQLELVAATSLHEVLCLPFTSAIDVLSSCTSTALAINPFSAQQLVTLAALQQHIAQDLLLSVS